MSACNQTVFNLGDLTEDHYVWREGTGRCGSCEMATRLFIYISSLTDNVKRLILYSETCGGQKGNINFSTMCLSATAVLSIEIIAHIYMESGHSQKECDSVHSAN